jgi:hypothetical protein
VSKQQGGSEELGRAPEYVQLTTPGSSTVVPVVGDRVTVGKAADNELVVSDDPGVSRLHALLERLPAGWIVRDLGSRNGTFVNGQRVWGDRPLHTGDEVRLGESTLVLRSSRQAEPASVTGTAVVGPELTRREHDVLLALCSPLVEGDVFTEPLSIRDIAARLVVTEAAVKQHVQHLYDKFGLHDADRRRARLANEAIRRGAVTLADLRAANQSS